MLAVQHQRLAEEQQRAAVAETTTQQLEALKRSNGNKSQAAAALGLSRTRFYTLLRRYGLG